PAPLAADWRARWWGLAVGTVVAAVLILALFALARPRREPSRAPDRTLPSRPESSAPDASGAKGSTPVQR
ncbi:MAG TPA: hypothetical protein VEY30_07005, partial [Myxococcaceae bacterium]|nr:hypothetical protein [Myxococcaceae bacterium]